MKKILLTAALLSGVSQISASGWNGFYVRTDLSVMGSGNAHKKNEVDALKARGETEGKTERLIHFAVAGGWGKVFLEVSMLELMQLC